MATLRYGTGMRLIACLRLRVQAVDFGQHRMIVRAGQGDKDRITLLPTLSKEPRCGVVGLMGGARWPRRAAGFTFFFLFMSTLLPYPLCFAARCALSSRTLLQLVTSTTQAPLL